MSPKRKTLLACIAAAGLLAVQPALSDAAPRPPSGGTYGAGSHGGPRHGGQYPSYSGGQRHYGHYGHSGHYRNYGYYGYYGSPYYWGWGLGLGLGVPWALGWGSPYYPSYAYGPVYEGYDPACGPDEDCLRERLSRNEPVEPTTQVPPAATGEDGSPTQRPLHLNYCDAARAWFPYVRSCPGGWRMIRPEYNR